MEFRDECSSFCLSPKASNKKVYLYGRFYGSGQAKLIGCEIRFFNLSFKYYIDDCGVYSSKLNALNLTVNIIPKQPLMKILKTNLMSDSVCLYKEEK